MTGELYDARTGRLLIARLTRADTLATQTVGYLNRSHIDDDEALWFDRCSGVHTLGMRVPIDVVFVDRSGTVLEVVAAVKPWRFWIGRAGAAGVLEMTAGNAQRRGIIVSTALEARWRSYT